MSFWETLLWVGLGVAAGLGMFVPVLILMWQDVKHAEHYSRGESR